MLLTILFAIDTAETVIAAIGALFVLVIGALTGALIRVRKAKTEDEIAVDKAKAELKREDAKIDDVSKATTFSQMQTIVQQLTTRVESQDKKIDARDERIKELSEQVAECHAERAELVERVKWLEDTAGKITPGSKEHKPLDEYR